MEHVEVLRHMKETIKAIMQSEVAALDAAIAALSAPQPEGEWVLVPRNPTEAMLDSAESAMIESECAYNAGEHDARSDAHGFPTMRIWQAVVGYRAMLAAAPQPPAEAQAVAWEWEYIGGDHYPRGHKVARSLREMDPTNPPYPETWRPTRPLIYGDTAPPSAPVGVTPECLSALRSYQQADAEGVMVTVSRQALDEVIAALTKQPAAVDGDDFDCPHSAFDNCDCYADQQGGSDNDR